MPALDEPLFSGGPLGIGPWRRRFPLPPQTQPESQPPDPILAFDPPVFFGGPMRMGPWRGPGPGLPLSPFPSPPLSPPPVPPAPPAPITGLPFIDRVESQHIGIERLRRATQKISTILNSLIRQRILVMIGDVDWTIDAEVVFPGAGATGTFTDTF